MTTAFGSDFFSLRMRKMSESIGSWLTHGRSLSSAQFSSAMRNEVSSHTLRGLLVSSTGWAASAMFLPTPAGIIPARSMLCLVSINPSRPWSMEWLLQRFRWVNPCFRSVKRCSGSPRKMYRLNTGAFTFVAGHSRLPTTIWAVENKESMLCEKRASIPFFSMKRRTPRSRRMSPVKKIGASPPTPLRLERGVYSSCS